MKQIFARAVVPAVWLLAGAQSAHADSVTINVAGTITASTCTIDPGSANQTVSLGSIAADQFTAVGTTTADKEFAVTLTKCGAHQNMITFTVSGTADPDNAALFQLGEAAGPNTAAGVGIELLRSDTSATIKPNSNADYPIANNDANRTFKFTARYKQTLANVRPGKANATITMDIAYK
ncbi:fimbrial protein [Trinickia mobilis]|uniref:fimbrial protein n=1 Tax=Trinickia mobilis TaxID=2816356 RepID=UPI001A8EDD52|nr:fimbrial protein [Trinickia mobilis]